MSTITLVLVLSPIHSGSAQAQHLYAWGDPWSTASSGFLYSGPTGVSAVPGTVVQIATSNAVSYALTDNGQVWAWGAGQFGSLGNGTAPAYSATPVQVQFPSGVVIASLPNPMPYDAGMAIDTNGNVWGWGSNVEDPLCIIQGNILYPEKLPLTDVTMASGAGWHALYDSGGKVYACGGNAGGELGNGTTVASSMPVQVVGLPNEPVKTLVSSWEGSGALMADGSFYDWGFNAADQLGNGATTDSDVPLRVNLPDTVSQISMGGSDAENGQTVAILSNGSTWAWGSNQFGQVGNGKISSSSGPTAVDEPPGVSFVLVNSGGSTTYGIDSTGAVWSWGQNDNDQLGVKGVTDSDVPIPVGIDLNSVSSTASNVAGLSGAPVVTPGGHSYDLVDSNGGVFAFGQPGTAFYNSLPGVGVHVNDIVGMAATADAKGYWLVGRDGGVYSFGDAGFSGSLESIGVDVDDVVGMVADPATGGYWLIGADGSVWDFGAPQVGSLPFFGTHVDNIVGGAATPDGGGLYLAGANGQVYSLVGDGHFQGDASALALNAPILAMVVDPATGGYWLLGQDGGIFSFGAPFFGSTGGIRLNEPVVGVVATSDGEGYMLVAADGGIFTFGDALYEGSLPGLNGGGADNIVGAAPTA